MKKLIPTCIILLFLAACGGGSGTFDTGGGGSSWQPGVFLDADTFVARCESPRSGINPATGRSYPDVAGTTLDENNFLRSWSNDTYLWYNEITDRDPALYAEPLDYFELLKTEATTPSGQPKDKFHFTYDSDEWYQLSQSGVSAGYGIQWAFLSRTPPRELRIAYTEPNTPATNLPQPLERGASILEIDGVDIDDDTPAGVDALNAGLFPSPGEQHTFTVQDPGSATSRTVTLTAASITSDPVRTIDVISTPTGEIGYILFNDHIATAEQSLIDAVNQLNAHNGGIGIDDLVLDLRYNGGGYLAIASELAYMIAGAVPTAGRIFEEMTFNDKYPATNPVTGQPLSPTPFYTNAIGPPFNGTPGQPLPTLDLGRVYVLIGSGTCSASESIINGLRGVGVDVYVFGSTTCGKPYGFYPHDNCGTTYFTIQFSGQNDVGFGDYSDGFSAANSTGPGEDVPGCSVADDFNKALGDPTEGRLAAALDYRDGQGCPAPTGAVPGVLGKAGVPADLQEVITPKSPWHTNRILLP
jgi:C-terminal processing protease CtpA/Prc